MIKKDKTLVILAGVVVICLLVTIFSLFRNSDLAQGSVTFGNDYNTTVITSTVASSTSTTFIKSGYGSLGSVVYSNQATAGAYPMLTLYNATSTAAATSTATTLFEMGAINITPGTYQVDAIFTNGLMYEVPAGFDGTFIVTWR